MVLLKIFALTLTLSASASESNSDLTFTEAQARKARIDKVEYTIGVKLYESDPTFTGQSEIRFELKDNSKSLRLDFFEGKVTSLKVNGTAVGSEAKAQYWIDLPASALKVGTNTVNVDFTQEYSRQGQGLHKFTDPQTKEVFLYSQFETFDANRFMPCFDQPDLRATYTLTVEAPKKWQVVSTTRESKITGAGDTRTWTFPKSQEISTYLFSLHAGPYKVFEDKYEDIPLRLFVRPTMAKYVRTKEWFKVTKQGLKFFNKYFGYKYPFKKYDQLIVPEFNAGAMENVAAVTFAERYLFRSEPTRDNLRDFAATALHEMAHMWFGDIVTMKWWNDLWLNESFATFMATLALAEATEYKEAWLDFFTDDKSKGYREDDLITTHPIESNVPSVKVAFATFDGITYGKGGAALKQLRAYVTPEAFDQGIQTYIQTHAFKNAELKDFIAAIQSHTSRDLGIWSKTWLRQSGTDKVASKWACDSEDKLKKVELIVTPSAGAEFRPQTVQVAILGSKPVRTDLLKSSTVIEGDWKCPSFIYPNFGDDGFIQVSLDPKSLDYVKQNLSKISDPLLRSMLWANLWTMVRQTEMPLKDYIQVLNTQFPQENDSLILKQVVQTLVGRRNIEDSTVLNYFPTSSAEERNAFVVKMEDEFLRRFKQSRAGSDAQREWFDNYVMLVRSPKALEQLSTWAKADPKNLAKGMPFDLDRKWTVARTLARFNQPIPEKFLSRLKKADTSDRGLSQAMAIESVKPDFKAKEKWVNILRAEKPNVSFDQARTVLRTIFPIEQMDLARRFADDFYQYLDKNGRSENEIFVEMFAERTAPLNCTVEESTRMREYLKSPGKFTPSIEKTMKEELDEDERCQRIRAMSQL